ncbi:hypothetical protein [Runella slithyformis]|uniref:Uncharacterized protein n=1 Tax=Runella slithyformis (strain ATCC 29530 / DSM 19594 / LMG 11500 / NCIMB 11436 / LSU 4) TaxID=761193 RepID=A0A7U3ZPZ6_RUNSL|nr:hypothetical protein [Runella slithyformis]AEI51188.1 hypothetical protein Runsl_4878 [Runella slithyformis DSM 19594]
MKTAKILLFVAMAFIAASCKVEDPFVDRVVAPVLLVFDNAVGDGGGFTTEPTVLSRATGSATVSVRILELDKTNILDFKKGIDSIPVTGLTLSLTTRTGVKIADITTDANGRATATKTWAEFGVASPRAGSIVALTLSGKYKEQSFSKLARLQAN